MRLPPKELVFDPSSGPELSWYDSIDPFADAENPENADGLSVDTETPPEDTE
ncbi:MAG: hypothetical protein LBP25_06365 [Tannerellaceae bacterium]|jgi:hypothetical protein|nr:hypothetical protein [Tannerellaceae bacterium]